MMVAPVTQGAGPIGAVHHSRHANFGWLNSSATRGDAEGARKAFDAVSTSPMPSAEVVSARGSIDAIGAALASGDMNAIRDAVEQFRSNGAGGCGKAQPAVPAPPVSTPATVDVPSEVPATDTGSVTPPAPADMCAGSEQQTEDASPAESAPSAAPAQEGRSHGMNSRLAALGEALASGDLAAAQQAFADFVAHRGENHGHHHHHDDTQAQVVTGTPPATGTPATTGTQADQQNPASPADPVADPGASSPAPVQEGPQHGIKGLLAALGEALASGDLAAAQQAFADFIAHRGEGHHHHHDEDTQDQVASSAPADQQPAAGSCDPAADTCTPGATPAPEVQPQA